MSKPKKTTEKLKIVVKLLKNWILLIVLQII